MNGNIVGSGVMGEKVWAVILVFVLASVPLMKYELKHVKAESNVWIVDDDRPADFRAIQDAVDAAPRAAAPRPNPKNPTPEGLHRLSND